jgi:hypothetical protein
MANEETRGIILVCLLLYGDENDLQGIYPSVEMTTTKHKDMELFIILMHTSMLSGFVLASSFLFTFTAVGVEYREGGQEDGVEAG